MWWEGLTPTPPAGVIDWMGRPYPGDLGHDRLVAHPNARFTVSLDQCPTIGSLEARSRWVPISAILLGGKRRDLVPLVREALNWAHGVYMGATVTSEQTAAAEGRSVSYVMIHLPCCLFVATTWVNI